MKFIIFLKLLYGHLISMNFVDTIFDKSGKILSVLYQFMSKGVSKLYDAIQNNNVFNYQAVAHTNNGTGNTINNTNIDVEISISSDTSIAPEFVESHSVSTNGYGLFSIQIGSIKVTNR